MSDTDFVELQDGLKAKDPKALQEFVQLCQDLLMPVIRRKLRPWRRQVQSRFDAEDVLQDALLAAYQVALAGKLSRGFAHGKAYLQSLARKKAALAVRASLVRRRDARQTQSLTAAVADAGKVVTGRPSDPLDSLRAADVWNQLTERLPPASRSILDLLRWGFTHLEAARTAGVNEKTVRRVLEQVRMRLAHSVWTWGALMTDSQPAFEWFQWA